MSFKDGSNTREGYTYHELPESGIPAQRPYLKERVDFILGKLNVSEKTVLDLGCNVGGFAYMLAKEGAAVDGVDYDSNAISIGNGYLEDKEMRGSVRLRVGEITLDWIRKQENYDIVLWLSQWQWFVKQHGLEAGLEALFEVSKKGMTLVFESAADDGRASMANATQDTIYAWLVKSTAYSDIRRYKKEDGWNDRDLFVCRNPIFEWGRHKGVVVRRRDRSWVEKVSVINKITAGMLHGVKFLSELQGTPIVPRLGRVGSHGFLMSYEGAQVRQLREEDIRLILKHLRKHRIVHRDINPNNLLWNGTNVVLIDFAWAVHEGEEFDHPEHVGGRYRCPGGFDDEYSLRKVKEELDEGMS